MPVLQYHVVHLHRVTKPWCNWGSSQLKSGLPKVNCKFSRGEPRVHRGTELSGGGLMGQMVPIPDLTLTRVE